MTDPCKNYKTRRNPCELIQRAVELVENPLSADYVDRHVIIINDYLEACHCGICVPHLPYVIKLLYLFSEKVTTTPAYRECFINLLKLCSSPPMLTKTSDVLTFSYEIQEYFTVFGYLLVVLQDSDIFTLTLESIKSTFSTKDTGTFCVSKTVRNEALAKSSLPDTICEMMCIVNQNIYYKLLETAEYLLELDDTCKKFVQNGMINLVLERSYPNWATSEHNILTCFTAKQVNIPHFDLSIGILWKLLQTKQKYPEIYVDHLVRDNTWRSVQCMLRMLSISKTKKQKRNNLVALLLCILKLNDVDISGEMANDLAILCARFELNSTQTWASNIIFSQETYDYSFKKLLLLAISYFPRNSNITRFLIERQLVLAILRVVTPEIELNWNDKQRCKLMRYALLALCEILECTIDDFIKYNGPARLLKMVEAFMKSQIRCCTVIACLHCILKSLTVDAETVIEAYDEQNASDVIFELLIYINNLDILSKQMQQVLACTFCVAELFCGHCDCYREDIIQLCLHCIARCSNPLKEDFLINPRILVACLDYLREYLASCPETLQFFITRGGVYVILDALERSPISVQLVALTMLVDLCDEGSCIPYLLTWRGNNTSLIPLLLNIFRLENDKIGVKTTNRGIIADTERPLMGEKQFRLTFRSSKDSNSSPAIMDILGSCRPKIYALLCFINCHKSEIVATVNAHYKISEPLSKDDEITKLLIENYLPLKFGEIWVELKHDVERAGIRPVIYDQKILSIMVRRFYKWSLFIKNAQEDLAREQYHKESIEEKIFYNHLRESHLPDALDALDDLRYFARCTENVFRLMAKMKQNDQLRNTLEYDPEFYIKFHMTFMRSLSVTPVFNQKVSIRSNIIIEPNTQNTLLEMVSPCNSVWDYKARQDQNLQESDSDIDKYRSRGFF